MSKLLRLNANRRGRRWSRYTLRSRIRRLLSSANAEECPWTRRIPCRQKKVEGDQRNKSRKRR